MNTYSRRSFLKLSGIALSATALQPLHPLLRVEEQPQYRGRALTALSVYQTPSVDAPLVTYRWPDSIVPILEEHQNWYRIEDGYVPRAGLQPMMPISPDLNITIPDEPFWAEVIGPVAIVRQHCAANAPLVTRIGHGGVAQIIDRLPDTPSDWYALADSDGQLLGWSQSAVWQPIQSEAVPAAERILHIDTQTRQMTAFEDNTAILQAPVSLSGAIATGIHNWQNQQIGGLQSEAYHGVPWVTRFGADYTITGVYWHNRFGESVPGPTVQVTPLLARWLYGWLSPTSSIHIT
ncbi:MAG: hypothetical protein K8L97_30325 [Anaerolineae bacterium]|nr:hypothetical protein [Anaerolineae bacterium]